MPKKLEGKIALVTGGGTGIGLATAKRFVAEGAKVVITGRRKEVLDVAVKEIGSSATGVQADAGNLADLDKLYAQIKRQHGRIDVLFAERRAANLPPIDQVTEEHFDKTSIATMKGVFFTAQKALPLIRMADAIVLNASVVSIKGVPAFSVYSATKAAVRSFARTWTNELKGPPDSRQCRSPGLSTLPQSTASPRIQSRQNS